MKYLIALLNAVCVVSAALARARVLASLDIPVTSFSCAGRPIGYYADVENNCQTYHMCGEKGEMYSYACPNTTLFHQRMLICAHWYQVNCNRSTQDYSANLLIGQRNKPFVDDITANNLNGISSESFRKTALFGDREGKSFPEVQPSPTNNHQFKQAAQRQDLAEAPSGSFVLDRHNAIADGFTAQKDDRPTVSRSFSTHQVPSRSTSTESTGGLFRPTNVSFRSTIETPNSDEILAKTAPMASAHSLSRTESAFQTPVNDLVTTAAPHRPSLELLPPLDESVGDTNTIELHLHDPRRAHYIATDGNEPPTDEPIVVSINLTGKSRFRPASPFARAQSPQNCPRCHPMFVVDRVNCSPCLLVAS